MPFNNITPPNDDDGEGRIWNGRVSNYVTHARMSSSTYTQPILSHKSFILPCQEDTSSETNDDDDGGDDEEERLLQRFAQAALP